MNKDYFTGIKIFMAVIETQSFSKASARVGLTQSAVSKAISNLEERLNVSLFNRTTRQVKPTTAGLNYYESCLLVTEELERAEENLKTSQNIQGTLVLDLPVLYGKKKLLPLILKIAKKYTEIDFVVNFTNKTVDLIDQNVDLAIRIGNLNNHSSLKARYLGRQKIVTCASLEYLKKCEAPQSLEDLKHHQCIVNLHQKTWTFLTEDQKSKKVLVDGRLKLEGVDACLEAALEGHGLVQVPYWLVEKNLKTRKLIPVLEEYALSLPIHALWINGKQKTSRKISVIIDELLKNSEALEG